MHSERSDQQDFWVRSMDAQPCEIDAHVRGGRSCCYMFFNASAQACPKLLYIIIMLVDRAWLFVWNAQRKHTDWNTCLWFPSAGTDEKLSNM